MVSLYTWERGNAAQPFIGSWWAVRRTYGRELCSAVAVIVDILNENLLGL